MDFKKTFLKLTEYTIPFGKEEMIIPYLKSKIKNLKKDSIGNYYVEIGNSETLFTTHLDTYSKNIKKVNHKIWEDSDGEWIGTDGKTILGGDNKNGTTILLYFIEQNIPGTYYFFIGEEPILSGGLYGSTKILKTNPDFFKKFKRAIAFDRKKMGSIVTRQLARNCCSNDFSEYLISEFSKNGLNYYKDSHAYYTDTAAFLDAIPEITNISAGGWGEHTLDEKTCITYVEKIAKAAVNIDWENAPCIRITSPITTTKNIKKYNKNITKKSIKTFKKINNILEMFNYLCLNESDFSVNTEMIFSNWFKNSEIKINIIGDSITIDNTKIIKNSYEFKKLLKIKISDYINIDDLLIDIFNLFDSLNIINEKEIIKLLDEYNIDLDEFIDFINSNDDINISYNNHNFYLEK